MNRVLKSQVGSTCVLCNFVLSGRIPPGKHYYDHTRAGTVEIHVLSMLGVIGAGLYTCTVVSCIKIRVQCSYTCTYSVHQTYNNNNNKSNIIIISIFIGKTHQT